jgi:transposase
MVGTLTNVVTAVEVTESHVNDSPMFVPVLNTTVANGFAVREVSADKAYLSNDNLTAVEAIGGRPFVPFKTNSTGNGSPAWQRLWHLYSANQDEFRALYHKRSNVESTFSMIKRKFGTGVRAKLLPAQLNEVLLKCLCHNLSVLVHSIHELNIAPKFWEVSGVRSA